MKSVRLIIAALIAAVWAGTLAAQPPVPHELLWKKRSGFHIPRTRAWDHENWKYFGGGPEIEDECGGAGHCWHRPAVWRCPEYILPPEPARWTVQNELILLKREHEDPQVILFDDVTNAPLFSMSDFNFDWQPTVRSAVQFNITPVAALEAVYMRVHDGWAESRVVASPLPIRVEMFGLSIVSPVDPFDLFYETQMQSGEVSFRRSYHKGAVTFITGFRWLEIDELFSVSVPPIATDLRVSTSNKLLGWQVGAEGQHWVNYGILRVDSSIKVGFFQNTSSNRARLATIGIPLVDVGTGDQAPAFVSEARVVLNAPVSKHCNVRGGYHAMYLSGLAIAADQINSITALPPAVDIDRKGDALYHGWFLGLEFWR